MAHLCCPLPPPRTPLMGPVGGAARAPGTGARFTGAVWLSPVEQVARGAWTCHFRWRPAVWAAEPAPCAEASPLAAHCSVYQWGGSAYIVLRIALLSAVPVNVPLQPAQCSDRLIALSTARSVPAPLAVHSGPYAVYTAGECAEVSTHEIAMHSSTVFGSDQAAGQLKITSKKDFQIQRSRHLPPLFLGQNNTAKMRLRQWIRATSSLNLNSATRQQPTVRE